MDHISKDNLHYLNKKLTKENQSLSLLVYSLQRQLQNAAVQINYVQQLEQNLELLQFELIQLKKDNQLYKNNYLQVTISDQKKQKIRKEIQIKQVNSFEVQTSKLMDLSKQTRKFQLIIKQSSPKGLTKKIYDNLIQKLQSTEEKPFQIKHKRRIPIFKANKVKQLPNSQKSLVSIPIISSISSIK
ncbi:unnamed protein product [Paramecium sonneborni]|uniref:Uncharacterized protein n=1 Tax=Paramecium sonneborni TaxID=65129 RepID=A0A8S1QLD9_9CILI|nr:unnamed protein product [Paramecium sonneborni]